MRRLKIAVLYYVPNSSYINKRYQPSVVNSVLTREHRDVFLILNVISNIGLLESYPEKLADGKAIRLKAILK